MVGLPELSHLEKLESCAEAKERLISKLALRNRNHFIQGYLDIAKARRDGGIERTEMYVCRGRQILLCALVRTFVRSYVNFSNAAANCCTPVAVFYGPLRAIVVPLYQHKQLAQLSLTKLNSRSSHMRATKGAMYE